MCQTQKEALFNLVVLALAIATVLLLYPLLGRGALGGLGLLGLLGLTPLFYRKRRGQVVADERDNLIRIRSMILAYSVFWVAFVGSAMLSFGLYGFDGAVPVPVIANAVWIGFMLVVGVQATATLVQYARGGVDGGR
jgi:hypothetical protein